jgi:uncharacterized protein (DUF697 family)
MADEATNTQGFSELPLEEKVRRYSGLSDQEKARHYTTLSDSDRVRLYQALPDNEKVRLYSLLAEADRKRLVDALSFEEQSRLYDLLKQEATRKRQEVDALETVLEERRKSELEVRKSITRRPKCQAIINRYALISGGVGLLPMPMLDVAALTGLQIKMIDSLAEQFGKNYTEEEARHTLTALVGGVMTPIAAPTVAGAAKFVPLVGSIFGAVAFPAAAAASTRLVGRLALERLEREELLAAAAASSPVPASAGQPSRA